MVATRGKQQPKSAPTSVYLATRDIRSIASFTFTAFVRKRKIHHPSQLTHAALMVRQRGLLYSSLHVIDRVLQSFNLNRTTQHWCTPRSARCAREPSAAAIRAHGARYKREQIRICTNLLWSDLACSFVWECLSPHERSEGEGSYIGASIHVRIAAAMRNRRQNDHKWLLLERGRRS